MMKQPTTPSKKEPFAWWTAFFAALGLYVLTFYLPDFILLATSFEKWSDAGFAMHHAIAPLIGGVPKCLITLVCPLGTMPVLLAALLPSRLGRTFSLCAPLLICSGLILYSQVTNPHTSKRRLQKLTRIALPQDHWNYLAVHPRGADLWSHPFAGTRDYYSFELPTASLKAFLEEYPPSEDWKILLLRSDWLLSELPAEFSPSVLNPDIQVSKAGHSGFLVTEPGSTKALLIWSHIPH